MHAINVYARKSSNKISTNYEFSSFAMNCVHCVTLWIIIFWSSSNETVYFDYLDIMSSKSGRKTTRVSVKRASEDESTSAEAKRQKTDVNEALKLLIYIYIITY